MDLKAEIGRRVRDLRKLRGLSRPALAELAEMTEDGLGDIERGESWPRPETVLKLAEALQVDLLDLFAYLKPDATEDERAGALLRLQDMASGLDNEHIDLLLALADAMTKQKADAGKK